MIEWSFTPADVARIRFAFSPLAELVRSLIVLRAPARHSLHLTWVRATRPRLARLDLTELFALIPIQGDTADFLTPPPTSPLPDLSAELETIRRTPPERVVADAADVLDRQSPALRRISADPSGAAHRLADALDRYWQVALDDHWPRIQALLEGDILWRSRQLAVGGAHALFEDLHDAVTWHGNALTAADPHHHHGTLSGEGLLLTPSVMCWPAVRKMIEPYQPTITYPARGIATLWRPGRRRHPARSSRSSAAPGLTCSSPWPNLSPPRRWPGSCRSHRARPASIYRSCSTQTWPPGPGSAASSSIDGPIPATR